MKRANSKVIGMFVVVGLLTAVDFCFAGSVSIVQVPNPGTSDGQLNLAGSVTNQILLDGPGTTILSQQVRLVLSSGSVLEHPFGSNVPPNPALMVVFPNLAFDSFVAAGFGPHMPTIVGRSDMLGGPGGVPARFAPNEWDVLWGPQLGQDTSNRNDYLSAQLTLSGDANGVFHYLASFGDGPVLLTNIPVVDGCIGCFIEMFPPVVGDLTVNRALNLPPHAPPILTATLPASDDRPLDQLVWSLDSFTGPNPIVDPPTLDPATGLFSWDISHAGFGGTFLAVIRATDADGLFDTGVLTILPAPEPASGVLAWMALIGLAAFARRRQLLLVSNAAPEKYGAIILSLETNS